MPLSLDFSWGGSGEQRYTDDEGGEDPSSVSDPHTSTDETATSLSEKILQYRWWVLTAGLAIVFVLLWIGLITTTLMPAILTSPWTHRLAAGLTIGGVAYRAGYSTRRATAEATDWLVLVERNRMRRFRGEYQPDQGTAPRFKPYKGLRGWWLFKSQEPYRIKDIKEDLTQIRSRPTTSVDDPAMLRLDQGGQANGELLWSVDTDTGTVVVALAGELEVDTRAHESVLRTTIPSVVHEEDLSEIEAALKEAEQERKQAEQEKHVMENQRDRALALAEESYDEAMARFTQFYTQIEEARGQGRASTGDDAPEPNGIGGVPTVSELEEVFNDE